MNNTVMNDRSRGMGRRGLVTWVMNWVIMWPAVALSASRATDGMMEGHKAQPE